MNFVVDGTLWEGKNVDLYDYMAGAILERLASEGTRMEVLGKNFDSRPLSLPPKVPWALTMGKSTDRLFPGGWWTKTVPRMVGQKGTTGWISWKGNGLSGPIAQWLIIKEVADLLWPVPQSNANDTLRQIRKMGKNSIGRPGTELVTFSARAAEKIQEIIGNDSKKITVLPAFYAPSVSIASWEDGEATKKQVSSGKDYFLWIGSLDKSSHWLEMLKAFSLFKKWQKSQMRLLMVSWTPPDPVFLQSLATYKYKDDIKMVDPNVVSWQIIFRSAYAVLYTPLFDELGWIAGMAMELEVPLISTAQSIAAEWAEPAVLWVQSGSPESVADAMMLLYKDEGFRSQLLQKGKMLAGQRSGSLLLRHYEQVLSIAPGQ